jgi:hypothetical protein
MKRFSQKDSVGRLRLLSVRRLFGLPNEEEDEPAGDDRDELAADPFTVTGEEPALGQPGCGEGEVDR